ncbi:MAG: hypothetical protein JWM31_2163, partial [Solirubrobacterales bacterium]|nr:hypothetical protein [Solirubrobacterales bacterium]
ASAVVAEPAAEVAAPTDSPESTAPASGRPKRLRGAAADDAIRATLKPLAPDERPPALLVAIGVAVFFGGANLVSFLLGTKVDGRTPPASGVLAFAGIMFTAAWGMWTKRYWALLGFQTLLGIIVIFFALFLPVASNLAAVGLCVAVAGLGGWLFWKLVRVLSRVQMPDRPGA